MNGSGLISPARPRFLERARGENALLCVEMKEWDMEVTGAMLAVDVAVAAVETAEVVVDSAVAAVAASAAVAVLTVDLEKCTTRNALTVVRTVKCRSSRQKAETCSVATVSRNTSRLETDFSTLEKTFFHKLFIVDTSSVLNASY
jgi:hypothetical protein